MSYAIKVSVERDGVPVGRAFHLADVTSQMAALELISALLTVVGIQSNPAYWGDPQSDALRADIANAQPNGRRRIVGVKYSEADVTVIG